MTATDWAAAGSEALAQQCEAYRLASNKSIVLAMKKHIPESVLHAVGQNECRGPPSGDDRARRRRLREAASVRSTK